MHTPPVNPEIDAKPSQTPRLIVREAVLADRGRVQEIASGAMRSFGIEPDFADLDRDLGRFGDVDTEPGTTVYLVAQWGAEVVGSLILSRMDEQTLKLSAFYVDAACRGQGVGRRLLREAVATSAARGYRRIYLETWEKMAAAVRLYTAFGWRRGERLAPASGAEWSYVLDLDGREHTPP
ncbi:MAG TPA: GNAT family N-acetyltransferase [Duganella sp.]|nr:GNAT family N-acetyltransferase [Duganella sp.]